MSGRELVLPTTGEIIDLGDARACAEAIEHLRELEYRVRELKKELAAAVRAEASRQGTSTLRLGPVEVTVGPDTEPEWDMAALAELREAGLPPERWEQLVRTTVEQKVNAAEANRIAANNPVYAEIIGRARGRKPRTPSVTVKRAT